MLTSSTDPHPLLGAGLEFRDAHGAVTSHAAVIAVFPSNKDSVGDLALIEHHDLFSGQTTTRRILPITELADHHWVFFASIEALQAHHRALQGG